MITHLSLFSGIGGLDLAAEMAGFVTVGQCEWADYPTKVLEKHWPDVPRWRDIRTLTKEDFYAKTGLRTVTIISGGFPCQPFSVAGKRKSTEDDRYLWPEMLRVIREIRPTWVLGENVPGIITLALDQVLSDLENIGYSTQAFVVPACGVDAPHKRERVCIIAYSNRERLQGSEKSKDSRYRWQKTNEQSTRLYTQSRTWPAEPNVGRVVNGLSHRVDRIKCLGNAVVPQQFYPFFKYIADLSTKKDEPMMVIFDYEVFAHEWFVVLKEIDKGSYQVFHNDNEGLAGYLKEYNPVFCGWNNKHYDNFIQKAVLAGFTPEQVKAVNDYIVGGQEGWNCPLLKDVQTPFFDSFDLRDDCEQGLSLKAFEGHLGMDIRESSVPFDIDRPLTEEERDEVIHYCKHDVDATHELYKIRKNYIQGKLNVGRMGNIPDTKALYATNAKLTAMFLGAKAQEHDDERKYTIPDNLLKEWIPKEVWTYFGRMYDPKISDEDLFGEKLDIQIGGTPGVIGYGGIHAAIPNFRWQKTPDQIISNFDVASYYPSLMIVNQYASRNLPSFDKYREVYTTRINAKRNGDKSTANTLKLVLNTTYGATLNQYNDLYDPLMARSVCISGQLYLLELAEHLLHDCQTLKIVQLNTDGIMILYDKSDRDKVLELTAEWQKRTGFGLEEDQINRIAQKDVNNYVMLDGKDHVKAKGGYVVRGVMTNDNIDFTEMGYPNWQNINGSAFKINNTACIVARAVQDYLLFDKPVEETIRPCQDIFQFQIIAKAGSGYNRVYQLIDGKEAEVQRCNRVYAVKDDKYGTLYKAKPDGSVSKIASLPEHCVVDNGNRFTVSSVDKQFYIDLAKKQIDDYLGIKPEKPKKERKTKMATAKAPEKQNVYQKLMDARIRFMDAGVKKHGKHMYLKYKYFTLDDIVPVAERIFHDLGLIPMFNFALPHEGESGNAMLEIRDMTEPEQVLTFNVPMPQMGKMDQITPVQELGANITYLRRYLYMLALDITEVDITDEGLTETPETVQKEAPKPPATPEKRKEIKKELTDANGSATDMQKKRLEKALTKLVETKPETEEIVKEILEKTDALKNITKQECEALMIQIGELLEG